MKSQILVGLFASFIGSVSAVAVPDVPRSSAVAPLTPEDHNITTLSDAKAPIALPIMCKNTPNICAANCYAILCLGQPRVLTRVGPKQKNMNRADSGAKKMPFQDTEKYNTGPLKGPKFDSAEEYPYASVAEGGAGSILAGVPSPEQRSQGGNLKNAYHLSGVNIGDKFKIHFDSSSPYCKALKNGDTGLCAPKKVSQKDNWYGFTYTWVKKQKVFDPVNPPHYLAKL